MNDTPTSAPQVPGGLTIALVLIALAAGTLLWIKAKRYVRVKANQHLFSRRDHREGQRLVSEHLHFTVRASSRQITQTVLASLRLAPHRPALIPDAYLLDATDAEIVVGYGSTLARPNFTARLHLRSPSTAPSADAAGQPHTSVEWGVQSWTLSDGVTDGVSVMRRLREDIESALHSLDPQLHRTVSHRRHA